jgi:ketosteroid isomerase-like protein
LNSNLSLPAPIAILVDAVNRGDTVAFLALLTDDASVDDWGRRFEGIAAIRAWSDKEFIGANGHISVSAVAQHGDTVTLEANWRSDFYSGASRFVFVLDGDRVREMRIPAR